MSAKTKTKNKTCCPKEKFEYLQNYCSRTLTGKSGSLEVKYQDMKGGSRLLHYCLLNVHIAH